MNHWVYDFLDRLQTKRLITELLPGTKPYTRSQIAKYLSPLMKNLNGQTDLNSTELDQLNYLKLEFKEELSVLGIDVSKASDNRLEYLRYKSFLRKLLPDFILKNRRNAFSVTKKDLRLNGDFVLFYQHNPNFYDFKKDRTLRREKRGITLWGGWGTKIKFYFDFRDATEWGGDYPELDNNWSFERVGYAQAKGDFVTFDETTSGLFFGHGFWQVMVGKEKNRWGPGRFGALALSDWATSYDQFKLQLKWSGIQFTSIAGFIRSYPNIFIDHSLPEEDSRNIIANKYLAAHRLEFMPLKNLIIGFHETLIYGERNLEPAYLNPINFYWSAEHYLGDQDNSAIGLDFVLFPIKNLKLYGELFIDDFQSGKLNSDWYGNKTAALIGFDRIDIFGISNLDFHFEGTRIRPYVYTHKYPINGYKHFTSSIGHWGGPNSQSIITGFDYRFNKSLLFRLNYEQLKHGANSPDKNAGGDLNLPHRDIDAIDQKFLDGILEKHNRIKFFVSYELFRNFYFNFEYSGYKFYNVLDDQNKRVDGSGRKLRVAASWNF